MDGKVGEGLAKRVKSNLPRFLKVKIYSKNIKLNLQIAKELM